MTLYDRNNPACDVLYELIFRTRLEEAPHLFYEPDKVKVPINKEDITTVYKLRQTDSDSTKEPRSHRLNMTMVTYNVNGELTSISK